MCGDESKVALRRIARRWLPERIHRRRKQGFVLPMRAWIREWLAARGGAAAYFGSHDLPGVDVPDLSAGVETALAAGVARERLLFALIMFAEWRAASRRRVAALTAAYGRA
jgi:asparagine synthase (glutamine-hydrolysing)